MTKRPLPEHEIVWRDPYHEGTVDVVFSGFTEKARVFYHNQFGYRFCTAVINKKEIARAGGWRGIIRAVHKYLTIQATCRRGKGGDDERQAVGTHHPDAATGRGRGDDPD